MTISVRLNDKDAILLKEYAKMHNISLSDFIRNSVLEKIEDEYDLKCYEQAIEKFSNGSKIYSFEEVIKELEIEWGIRLFLPIWH